MSLVDLISSDNCVLCSFLISKTRVLVLQWTSSVVTMFDSLNDLNHFNFSRLSDVLIFELVTVYHRSSVNGSCSLRSPVQIKQFTW